jgi:hypothetical protein
MDYNWIFVLLEHLGGMRIDAIYPDVGQFRECWLLTTQRQHGSLDSNISA